MPRFNHQKISYKSCKLLFLAMYAHGKSQTWVSINLCEIYIGQDSVTLFGYSTIPTRCLQLIIEFTGQKLFAVAPHAPSSPNGLAVQVI